MHEHLQAVAEDAASPPLPAGNAYDKYGTKNPLARALVQNFRRGLDDLWGAVRPSSQLDCGCGEGELVRDWALKVPERRFVGVDLEGSGLAEQWAAHATENLEYRCGDVTALPYVDGEFDLVTGIEVLEHVPDPRAAISEMARVARRYVLVSVPREPLWRALNVARGAYLSDLGNTPGHVNHWSHEGFVRFAGDHGAVERILLPFPWTIVLLRVRDRRRLA